MGNLEVRKIVRRTILQMERPFNVADLFYKLKKNYGIGDRALILEVLDELCENGIIDYSEVKHDCWAFEVVGKGRTPVFAN